MKRVIMIWTLVRVSIEHVIITLGGRRFPTEATRDLQHRSKLKIRAWSRLVE